MYDINSIRNRAIKELFRLRVGGRRAKRDRKLCLVRGKQLIESIAEHFRFQEAISNMAIKKASYI